MLTSFVKFFISKPQLLNLLSATTDGAARIFFLPPYAPVQIRDEMTWLTSVKSSCTRLGPFVALQIELQHRGFICEVTFCIFFPFHLKSKFCLSPKNVSAFVDVERNWRKTFARLKLLVFTCKLLEALRWPFFILEIFWHANTCQLP